MKNTASCGLWLEVIYSCHSWLKLPTEIHIYWCDTAHKRSEATAILWKFPITYTKVLTKFKKLHSIVPILDKRKMWSSPKHSSSQPVCRCTMVYHELLPSVKARLWTEAWLCNIKDTNSKSINRKLTKVLLAIHTLTQKVKGVGPQRIRCCIEWAGIA